MIKTTILIATPMIMLYIFFRTTKAQRKNLLTPFSLLSLGILFLIILPGFRLTTIYNHCTEATELALIDVSNAYILDKSIRNTHENTSSENKKINGKFELCFGERCTKGYYYHFRPKRVQSNKVKLTGKMREISPKLLISAFVDTQRDVEAIIDNKRVWVGVSSIDNKFIALDSNKSITFYKWKYMNPLTDLDNNQSAVADLKNYLMRYKFQCPLESQKILDWELSW